MRRTVCLLAALLVLSSLGSDAPKEYEGATEIDGIEGVWRLIASESNGLTLCLKDSAVETYLNGKWEYSSGDGSASGIYKADGRFSPAHLDRTHIIGENRPEITRTDIYRVDGDTLRVGRRKGGDGRPSSFGEKDVTILIYERIK
jgi:uncharacterized protein (TIGR03067 family)